MKAGVISIYVLTCMLISLSARGQQQPAGYWIQHFTDENGLPQNSVKAVAQDKNGFIWLTTEAGLVRFDGHRFITFEKSVVPISSNRLRGFIPAVGADSKRSGQAFYALSEKGEYIGILPNGLAEVDTTVFDRYKKYNPLVRNVVRHNSLLSSLPAQYEVDPYLEHYLAASDNRTCYVWQKDKVICFQHGRHLYTSRGPYRQFFLVGSKPYGRDVNGNFQAISANTSDAGFEGDILRNSHFPVQKNNVQLFWNNVSHQAFIYLNKCLYILDPLPSGNLKTRLIIKDFDFDHLHIVATYLDENSGSLFLGSLTKGLFLIKKENFQTHKLYTDNADNVYYAQIPGPGRSVLTSQGYLLGSNFDGSVVSADRVSSLMEQSPGRFNLAQTRDGSFWFGIGLTIYKMDRTGRKVLASVKLPEKAKTLLFDLRGKLWIGCETNAIYSIREENGQYAPQLMFRTGVTGISLLGCEDKETMFLDAETGFFRIKTRTGVIQAIKPFENITVRSTYTSADGTWITTYGNGIYLLRKNKVIKFPLDNDRFLANAHCIVEDKKGFFWINTNRGLFQVAKRQLLEYASKKSKFVYYLYYDKRHGFSSNEFNGGCQPCAVTLADGTVSLPSMDGLVWFKPETIKPELPESGIFISAIQEDARGLKVRDSLEISRDFGQLKLTVTTPYLGNEKNVHMDYSLSGMDGADNWLAVNQDQVVVISKMSYGDYLLKIRKVDGFRTGDFAYKTVYLHVPRAWYETWWFRGLAILLAAGLFMMSVRLRTAYHIRREREANLIRHYRVISQIIAAVNHDIQTPLHYIGFSLKQFNAYVHKQITVDPLILRMSDETLNTSERLNTLTKNILDYIKLQSKSPSERRRMTDVNVYELVFSVLQLFSGIATHREVCIKKEINPTLTVWSDSNLLSIIIHNLIDNALKVSQSEITISAENDGGRKRIIIEDDGGGMPRDQISWLNRSYRSYEDWLYASQNPGQKGIGLVIVKDLCVLLGIDVVVHVTEGEQTVITLAFNDSF